MKSIWNVKKKIQVAKKKNQTKVPWMEKSKAWSSEGLLRSEEVESTIDGKKIHKYRTWLHGERARINQARTNKQNKNLKN